MHCQAICSYKFNLILDQVQGYEPQLQQPQTELENALEKLDSAGKECLRLSSENGNFISKVIYHFHDRTVFACAFQNCLRETEKRMLMKELYKYITLQIDKAKKKLP